jgi:hypothetical protein
MFADQMLSALVDLIMGCVAPARVRVNDATPLWSLQTTWSVAAFPGTAALSLAGE